MNWKNFITPVLVTSLIRTFTYSLMATGQAAVMMDAVPPHWKLAIQLFIIQAGVMLAFLDQTMAKMAAPSPNAATLRSQQPNEVAPKP